MTPSDLWESLDLKLIAILRGIRPKETEDIVSVLLDLGIRAIEVPMNSPDPLASIRIAVNCAAAIAPGKCLVGAGTVLTAAQVDALADVGANLVVSPNVNPDVIARALRHEMACLPGVFSPTEAHLAVALGATALKFFPASLLGPSGIKAIAATLPKGTGLCAVGGVGAEELSDYRRAGVIGFGLGSNIYKPGHTAKDVADAVRPFTLAGPTPPADAMVALP